MHHPDPNVIYRAMPRRRVKRESGERTHEHAHCLSPRPWMSSFSHSHVVTAISGTVKAP